MEEEDLSSTSQRLLAVQLEEEEDLSSTPQRPLAIHLGQPAILTVNQRPSLAMVNSWLAIVGQISHSYERIEYQSRGSSHCHALFSPLPDAFFLNMFDDVGGDDAALKIAAADVGTGGDDAGDDDECNGPDVCTGGDDAGDDGQ